MDGTVIAAASVFKGLSPMTRRSGLHGIREALVGHAPRSTAAKVKIGVRDRALVLSIA
jgi:hypothetical protein